MWSARLPKLEKGLRCGTDECSASGCRRLHHTKLVSAGCKQTKSEKALILCGSRSCGSRFLSRSWVFGDTSTTVIFKRDNPPPFQHTPLQQSRLYNFTSNACFGSKGIGSDEFLSTSHPNRTKEFRRFLFPTYTDRSNGAKGVLKTD